jgi:hypothetical protein
VVVMSQSQPIAKSHLPWRGTRVTVTVTVSKYWYWWGWGSRS